MTHPKESIWQAGGSNADREVQLWRKLPWTQQLSAAWFPQSTSRHIQAVQDVEAEGSAPKRNRDELIELEIMAENIQKTIPNPSPHVTTQLVVHPQVILGRWTDIFGSSVCHGRHPLRSCLRPGMAGLGRRCRTNT